MSRPPPVSPETWCTEENASGDDPEVLRRILGLGQDDRVSWQAAGNPSCPPDALTQVLARDDWVSWQAARNPSCPPDALAQVLARGEGDSVSWCAAFNPSCPPDALAQVLARGKDDMLSREAARNPNCPLDAKMRWYALFAPEPDRPEQEEMLVMP